MHVHSLSPVIFLLFIILIWNIIVNIFVDIIYLVLWINFVMLRVFRRMHPPRWYVWILYYNQKYFTLLAALWHLHWSYSCHRLPIKSHLYRAKLWYCCLLKLYHRLPKKTIVWHSHLSWLLPHIIYKEFISSYFPSILLVDGFQGSCTVTKYEHTRDLFEL